MVGGAEYCAMWLVFSVKHCVVHVEQCCYCCCWLVEHACLCQVHSTVQDEFMYHFIIPYLWSTQIWPVCNKVITEFYLPPTHEPYLPLLPSHKASSPLRLPTKGSPGWVDLGGWLDTEIDVPRQEMNPDMVTYPSINRTQRTLTSLIKTNALPLCQTATVLHLHTRCHVRIIA